MPALLLLAALLAQDPPLPAVDATQLSHIRKALDEPLPPVLFPAPIRREGAVFRVTVHAPKPVAPPWADWSHVPSYIRPKQPLYQFEYLQQVTPEAFRESTLYSMDVPIGTMVEQVVRRIRAERREAQERRARAEVRQALAAVLACRADPSRPEC